MKNNTLNLIQVQEQSHCTSYLSSDVSADRQDKELFFANVSLQYGFCVNIELCFEVLDLVQHFSWLAVGLHYLNTLIALQKFHCFDNDYRSDYLCENCLADFTQRSGYMRERTLVHVSMWGIDL